MMQSTAPHPSQSAAVIQLQDIGKSYWMAGEQFHALQQLSLQIYPNEHVAIIGPSGSGKSTLLNLLGCLDTPTKGEYLLAGHKVADLDETALAGLRNQQVGFIFQSFNLLPRMTALQNVMQPLVYRLMPTKERECRARAALAKVGLSDKTEHFPNQLSGGQRQRVAIARALVTEPAILLGDEPTGNLDSKTTSDIMQLFDELHAQGHTIILVTHEQEIADHCQRVIRLVDGKLAADSQLSTTDSKLKV
jgi:putative ABC transport system ATP-binding protein